MVTKARAVGICKQYDNSQLTNHNHRRCRWYAQAPLGPFTSRAYRLIE